ncbi:OLC1v1001970C1 [Oldenlandia corymbosa var. corymbosa]|uniref:OLC1v1001970C1 n=1 Tax=Oldenlandia corymbosa var. corymbosa TaxID=529605 RepID=A0AAV1D917_OLDCO|nr:OLC1v1001970C1 [Oldenlandia corymbosa var. corymbosa]
MGRGSKVGFKRGTRKRARSVDGASDESDEDFIVGEEEEIEESEEEEYASSFDDDESEASFADFEEDDEEEEEEYTKKKVKKTGRTKKVKPVRKRSTTVKPKRSTRASYREEDDDDDWNDSEENFGMEDEDVTQPRKKNRVSYQEQDDENYDDDDDDDEEFRPDEVHDELEDDEDVVVSKKNKKLGRPPLQKKSIRKVKKGKRTPKVLKKTVKKTRKHNKRSNRSDDREFIDNKIREDQPKKKITGRRGRRSGILDSDSDFVNSGLSDYEYTISEEEREQIQEANEFCRNLSAALRSSIPKEESREEEEPFNRQRKRLRTKGKGKEEVLKVETGKQVCGICLSEEGKRTIRGTLNCCSHYFCFACIMEWSKVESRCPLCKQRFITISKPSRVDSGFDLRTVVIQVPERDQVYQPSEEELRGFLDPYESVICTECHHGGDDALMLLCDLCDSPAHTYCVGLGHEVPEGNWYCEGCRPTAMESLSTHLDTPHDRRTSNNLSSVSSPVSNVRETFDLNEAYVPDTPLSQMTGQPSPRFLVADIQASSPTPGSGAATLFERRRIQRQIHQIISNRRLQDTGIIGTRPPFSVNSLLGTQIGRGRELAPQYAVASEGRIPPNHMPFPGRQDYGSFLFNNTDAFPTRPTLSRGPVVSNQASTSAGSSFGGLFHTDFTGVNARNSLAVDIQQIHPRGGGPNIGSDANVSPQCREVRSFNTGKEQVQSMVKSHLKSLSREWELGYTAFKDIARSSTHTILAACGLEHRSNEVYPMNTRIICTHGENEAGELTSPMKRHCSTCFDLFVGDVVQEIINHRVAFLSKD